MTDMMILCLLLLVSVSQTWSQELKLVHVIYSHQFYAPVQTYGNGSFRYPERLDYQHFLENTNDMINPAKMDLYNVGLFLRQRYDKFLGDIYYPEIMQVRTTEYVLSMISAQLVNAGLWPPMGIQTWNDDLAWQPIPTDYKAAENDTLLLGTLCPSFLDEEEIIYDEQSSKPSMTDYEKLYKSISDGVGVQIKQPSDVALLYSLLRTLRDENITLPSWSNGIFPDGEMAKVTLLTYDMLFHTDLQKKLHGGTLISKIINDSLLHEQSNGKSKRKLYMYSGEERNVIGALQSLGLWEPHILNPGESLIFEIHENSSINKYTVTVLHYNGVDDNKINQLDVNGCKLCSLTNFSKYLLPVDEQMLCQNRSRIVNERPSTLPGASNALVPNFILSLFITIYIFNAIEF